MSPPTASPLSDTEACAPLAHPVSEAQRRFLAAEARGNGTSFVHRALCILPPAVARGALRQAFARVSELQDAFRTSFQQAPARGDRTGPTFMQRIQRDPGLVPIDRDTGHTAASLVRALTAGELFERLHPRIDPFGAPPLARAHLLRTVDGATVFALTVHHAIFDGASGVTLLDQLSALLQADAPDALLPSLRRKIAPYREFVQHQRAALSGPSLEALLNFWREYLAASPSLQCSPGASSPAAPDLQFVEVVIDAAHCAALRARARAHRITPHLMLLGCMQWAIAASSGVRDVLTATPTRNRPARFAHTIGCFINPAIVRQQVRMASTLADNLAHLRASARAAYRHAALPLAHLETALFPAAQPRLPLAQGFFAVQVDTSSGHAANPLGLHVVNLPPERAMAAPYALELRADCGGLRGRFQSRSCLDPDQRTARLFEGLVTATLHDPELVLGRVIRAAGC